MFLAFGTGAALAQQTTIYVDTGGNDAFDGTQANPVRTIQEAINRAAADGSTITTISIEAGTYGNATISSDADLDGLVFVPRVDQTTNATVVSIGTLTNAADGITFGEAGGTASFRIRTELDLNAGDDASSGFTAIESDVVIASGADVDREVGAGFSGALSFAGTVDVLYEGAGDITAGGELPATIGAGSTLTVGLASGTAADPNTLTLSTQLGVSGGTVTVTNADVEIGGAGILVSGTGSTFAGAGNVGDVTVQAAASATINADAGDLANAGTVDINADITVDSIDNDGTLDFAGQTLTVLGDFDNSTENVIAGSIFFDGTAPVTFTGGPNFALLNLTIGDGTEAKVVTFTQDVEVDGTFTVANNATANLAGTFITVDTPIGTADVDGTVTSTTGAIIFTEDGQTLSGTGTVSNVFVALDAGASVLDVVGDLDFSDTFTVQQGVVNLLGDLSPAAAGDPTLVINTSLVTDFQLDGVAPGTFNADGEGFNLTYSGTGNYVAGVEFDTENIVDLLVNLTDAVNNLVDASGADEDGTIDGTVTISDGTLTVNANIIVDDTVTVASGGRINNITSLQLNESSFVDGIISGGGNLILTDGVTVTGASDEDEESRVQNVVVANDATATITGLNRITGTITFADPAGATLNLGLHFETGGVLTDGIAEGNITLQDNTLNLTTDVRSDADVNVNTGLLALGDNDLILVNAASSLTAGATGAITAGDGSVNFTVAGQNVDVNGIAIPNVVNSVDVILTTDLVISDSLNQTVAGAGFTAAAGQNLDLSGVASLEGGEIYGGAGIVTIDSLTATMDALAFTNGAQVVQAGNFTLVGDDFEVRAGEFEQDAGVLALGSNNLILSGDGLVYDYDGGTVTGTTGALFFQNGTTAQTYNLAAALTVPNLIIENAVSVTDADGTADNVNLTIGTGLQLRTGALITDDEAGKSDITLASGVTLTRWDDGSISTAPNFPGDSSLTVVYGDTGAGSGAIAGTGPELPAAVANLYVYDSVNDLNSSVVVTDELLIAATLDATDGGTVSDTFVTLGDASDDVTPMYTLSGTGNVPDAAGQEVVFVEDYNLMYLDYTVQATGQELNDNVITVTVDQGAVGAQTIALQAAQNGVTVENLNVVDGTFDFNDNRLNVELNVTLAEAGSLINTDGAPAGVGATLAFVGDTTSVFSLAADFNVPNGLDIRIDKDMDPVLPPDSVNVTGGSIIFDTAGGDDETLILAEGVLRLDDGDFVKLDHENTLTSTTDRDRGQGFFFPGDDGFSAFFPRSWVAGEIRKDIVSLVATNQDPGRVEFPTGDSLYAEFVLDFEAFQNQEFGQRTIAVEYFRTRPAGNNFPMTDENLGSSDFYWEVTSNVSLSSATQFNVEARADKYELSTEEEVEDLRLLRRQADQVDNPYTIVGTSYDNFIIDPTEGQPLSGDEVPVVVAQNAKAGFGPQGTVFTYGVPGDAPPPPVDDVLIQVIHAAPSAPGLVDVYVNNVLLVNDLAYKNATAYLGISIPTDTAEAVVVIAPSTSTSSADGITSDTLTVMSGSNYVVIAANDGVDGEADAADLIVAETDGPSTGTDQLDILAAHVVPGAGAVDFRVFSRDFALANGLAYGDISAGTPVGAAEIAFGVYPAGDMDDANVILKELFDFSGLAGDRGVLIAGGLLDAPDTQPTRALDLYYVTSQGVVIQGVMPVSTEDPSVLPTEIKLLGVYPNPLRNTAQVSFDLPEAAEVKLAVFDLLGRKVMTVDQSVAAGAARSISFDGTALSSGVYLYQLQIETAADARVETGRMTVVR